MPVKSLKGLALLFVGPDNQKGYTTQNELSYNPSIQKIGITIEGEPNQLYSHGMQPRHVFESIKKYFGHKDNDVSLGDFLTTKYCLWLDFRLSPDNFLSGSGINLENMSSGITLQIEKAADGSGSIKCYIFVVQDAQLNLVEGRFHSVEH